MNEINWMAISRNIATVDFSIDETNICSCDDDKTLSFLYIVWHSIEKHHQQDLYWSHPQKNHRPYTAEHCHGKLSM
jgi:hypothetical protein